jgi:hypothetical protein
MLVTLHWLVAVPKRQPVTGYEQAESLRFNYAYPTPFRRFASVQVNYAMTLGKITHSLAQNIRQRA